MAATSSHGGNRVADLLDGWVPLPRHPTGVLEGSSLWHEGELWSIAGHPCQGKKTFSETNVYALREGDVSWQRRPRLPQLHHIFHAAFSLPGRISIMSGLEALSDLSSHRINTRIFELDTSAAARSSGDRWAWRAYETNLTFGGMTSCAPLLQQDTGGPAYCVAGASGNFMPPPKQPSRNLFAFYPLSRRVQILADVPREAQTNHLELMRLPGDRLLLMTGRSDVEGDGPTYEALFVYSIAGNAWSLVGPTPSLGRGFDTRAVWQHPTEPWALLFGGQNADDFVVTAAILRIDFDAGTDFKWTAWASLPQALSGLSVVTAGGAGGGNPLRLRVFGGALGVGIHCTSDVYEWDVRPDPGAALTAVAARPDLSPDHQPLVVVAAFYGPYIVTRRVQELIDSGVRGLHMGRGGRDPRQLGGEGTTDSARLSFHDLGVPLQETYTLSLAVVLRDSSGSLRTVTCPRDGGCLF